MSELRVNNVSEAGGDPVIASGVLDSGSLPAGTILQVQSVNFDGAKTTTSTVEVFTKDITPSSSSSKILILFTAGMFEVFDAFNISFHELKRNGTVIALANVRQDDTDYRLRTPSAITFLDSPNTTSAVTYSVDLRSFTGGETSQSLYHNMVLLEVAG